MLRNSLPSSLQRAHPWQSSCVSALRQTALRRSSHTSNGGADGSPTAPVSDRDARTRPLSPRAPTKVEKIIADSIRATGPLSVARYMQLCLAHPTEGYYMKRDVFGAKGDFVTSPEISQTFGELLAVWFASEWQASGSPKATRLIELGPGRGTLLSDILRTFSSLKGVLASLKSIHLVENSRTMRKMQEDAVSCWASASPFKAEWHDDLEEVVPDDGIFTMLVAHEFFDAMPIHMLEKCEGGYREIVVDLADPERENKTDYLGLRFAKSALNTPFATLLSQTSSRFQSLPVGTRLEVSPQSTAVAAKVAELVGGPGNGTALIVDYGDDHVFGSSLRAFKEHRHVDIFDEPGMCDITANVDFASLREAMESKAAVHGPVTQRHFLMSLGLAPRLDALMKAAETKDRKLMIAHAARRLVDSSGMGSEYKMMAVTGRKEAEPYPFGQVGAGEEQ